MRVPSPIVCLCAAALALGQTGRASAGEVRLSVGGGQLAVPVVSRKELPFQGVVRQRYDFSCGSAALATLLTFHYDRPTAEAEAFEAMYRAGDQATIRAHGFSLLDIKDYLAARGLRAEGFRVTLDLFARERIPAIALVNLRGYRHFVVLKGMRDGRVLVGDPALGVASYERARFEAMWNGILLVVVDERETLRAQAHFNQGSDWRLLPKAPFGRALDRDSLAAFGLSLPFPSQIRPVIN